MEQNIITDPAARQKGRLGRVYHALQRRHHPTHQDTSQQLDVAVEQGDGAVGGDLVGRLVAALVQQGDNTPALGVAEAAALRGVGKGLVEALGQRVGQHAPKGLVHLVGEAVAARRLAARRALERLPQAGCRHGAVSSRALALEGLRRRHRAVHSSQQQVLVGGADIAGGKQPAGAAVKIGAEGVADGRHAASFVHRVAHWLPVRPGHADSCDAAGQRWVAGVPRHELIEPHGALLAVVLPQHVARHRLLAGGCSCRPRRELLQAPGGLLPELEGRWRLLRRCLDCLCPRQPLRCCGQPQRLPPLLRLGVQVLHSQLLEPALQAVPPGPGWRRLLLWSLGLPLLDEGVELLGGDGHEGGVLQQGVGEAPAPYAAGCHCGALPRQVHRGVVAGLGGVPAVHAAGRPAGSHQGVGRKPVVEPHAPCAASRAGDVGPRVLRPRLRPRAACPDGGPNVHQARRRHEGL